MKKVLKVIGIIIIVIIITNIYATFNTKCFANKATKGNTFDVTESPDSWKPKASNVSGDFQNMLDNITGLVRTIGVIVSVGTLSIIGIKYLIGSIEERAQYKQTLLPWLIGAIMVFSISTIPALIYDITKGMMT